MKIQSVPIGSIPIITTKSKAPNRFGAFFIPEKPLLLVQEGLFWFYQIKKGGRWSGPYKLVVYQHGRAAQRQTEQDKREPKIEETVLVAGRKHKRKLLHKGTAAA